VTGAPAPFDEDKTYDTGDTAIFGDVLWVAEMPVVAGSPFNPAQWTALGDTPLSGSREPAASGVISGGVISLVSGNTVSVTTGYGAITGDGPPTIESGDIVEWPALSGPIAAGGVLVRAITVNRLAQLGSVAPSDLAAAFRERIVLGYVYYDSTGDIVHIQNAPRPFGQAATDLIDYLNALGGPFVSSGARIAAAGGMQVQVSSGTVFAQGFRWRSVPNAPNIVAFPSGSPVTFDIIDAAGVVVAAAATNAQVANWQGGSVPAGFATIQYLFATPTRDKVWLQIGQVLYPTLAAAQIALAADWRAFSTGLAAGLPVVVLGAVIATREATDLTDPDQGVVVPVRPGPRANLVFDLNAETVEFRALDGSSVMAGDLDMGGNSVLNAVIDEGIF